MCQENREKLKSHPLCSFEFPDPRQAVEGLVCTTTGMNPEAVLSAYCQGLFPWPGIEKGREWFGWFSPDPRAILELDELHLSRRLQRRLRTGEFQVSMNRDFPAVIRACSRPRQPGEGTWITPGLIESYDRLHQMGFAHSVETWKNGQLAGGIYGIAIGGLFAAESMFYRETDGSKVALCHLVEQLRTRGYRLLDVQVLTDHSRKMGAREIPRDAFLGRLGEAIFSDVRFHPSDIREPTEDIRDPADG